MFGVAEDSLTEPPALHLKNPNQTAKTTSPEVFEDVN